MGGSVCVTGACVRGAEALPVSVEVACSSGIPGISLVGMPDSAVAEAPARVRCAISACGFKVPRLHLVVNLAPGELRKTGTGLDLPIAVAILAATGQIPTEGLSECLFVGELSLEGEVQPVRGAVAYQRLAGTLGLRLACSRDCRLVPDWGEVGVMCRLAELRQGTRSLSTPPPRPLADGDVEGGGALDFSQVHGQEEAKRAITIAAAGSHGLLMVGPPGAGKTMLARRVPGILPPLTEDEREEVLLMASVAGQPTEFALRGERPFRSPHHSVSMAGLVGGGRPVIPGEISLADHGVLFLDELPEFAGNVLQALRQPMEEGQVRLVRADGTYAFPCRFLLIAAANPCPCGHYGDPGRRCTCPPGRVERYRSRIGGPLMDRIDIHLGVRRPESGEVLGGDHGATTAQMRDQVARAREFSSWRQRRSDDSGGLSQRLGLEERATACLEGLGRRNCLGGRSIVKVALVARTIADLQEHETVSRDDVTEASLYRGLQ